MIRSTIGLLLVFAALAVRAADPEVSGPEFAGPEFAGPEFAVDVMSVLSKAGCNAGTCHGNLNGKGGFKLSLRGQDALHDYHSLVLTAKGRRVSTSAPQQSLFLQKASGGVAHRGPAVANGREDVETADDLACRLGIDHELAVGQAGHLGGEELRRPEQGHQ